MPETPVPSEPIPASLSQQPPEPPSQTPPIMEKPPRRDNKRTRVMIALFLGIAVITTFLLMCLPLLINKAAHEALIKIPKNATREMVNDSIAKYLDDDYAASVMRVARLRGSDFGERHGAYLIEHGMSPLQAEHRLSHGAQHPLTVTVNNFRGLDQMAKRIAARLDFTADSLLSFIKDPEMLSQYGLTTEQALSLFPEDSYEVYWTASPQGLVDKIGANYMKIWNDERRAKADSLGLSPAEVMTLCSIVDEETNKLDEKGKIGRLYINRLNKGMKLQADPTVKFALGDFSLRRIRQNHLSVNSPYNTYRNTGLPPGPIRTTSVATIDAILNSEPSDHIYMCAKEDFSGRHNFAATYSEHMANARRYQQALNKRGIK